MHDAWRAAVEGFTQEDVDELRSIADERHVLDRDALTNIADRIAERLPPREKP